MIRSRQPPYFLFPGFVFLCLFLSGAIGSPGDDERSDNLILANAALIAFCSMGTTAGIVGYKIYDRAMTHREHMAELAKDAARAQAELANAEARREEARAQLEEIKRISNETPNEDGVDEADIKKAELLRSNLPPWTMQEYKAWRTGNLHNWVNWGL